MNRQLNKMDTSPSARGPRPGPSSVRKITRRREPGVADPVDVHVGSRVRLRRTLLGLSQEKLGEAVGLTFQQIQKYERGANRIGGSRMYDLAHVLDVPPAFFFEDMPDEIKKRDDTPSDSLGAHTLEEADKDPATRRETLELVRAYYKIGGTRVRKRVFELIKSLAKMNGEF